MSELKKLIKAQSNDDTTSLPLTPMEQSIEAGYCVVLHKLEETYVNDPMSNYAPSECLDSLIKNHKRKCEICKQLK